jgi:hypothetical protein
VLELNFRAGFCSVCASVCRRKYFPLGDILNCQLKRRANALGKLFGQLYKHLNKDICGELATVLKSVCIQDDPWILSKKIATRRGNIVYTKVSELIDSEMDSWNEEIIKETFWPINVQHILSAHVVYILHEFMA